MRTSLKKVWFVTAAAVWAGGAFVSDLAAFQPSKTPNAKWPIKRSISTQTARQSAPKYDLLTRAIRAYGFSQKEADHLLAINGLIFVDAKKLGGEQFAADLMRTLQMIDRGDVDFGDIKKAEENRDVAFELIYEGASGQDVATIAEWIVSWPNLVSVYGANHGFRIRPEEILGNKKVLDLLSLVQRGDKTPTGPIPSATPGSTPNNGSGEEDCDNSNTWAGGLAGGPAAMGGNGFGKPLTAGQPLSGLHTTADPTVCGLMPGVGGGHITDDGPSGKTCTEGSCKITSTPLTPEQEKEKELLDYADKYASTHDGQDPPGFVYNDKSTWEKAVKEAKEKEAKGDTGGPKGGDTKGGGGTSPAPSSSMPVDGGPTASDPCSSAGNSLFNALGSSCEGDCNKLKKAATDHSGWAKQLDFEGESSLIGNCSKGGNYLNPSALQEDWAINWGEGGKPLPGNNDDPCKVDPLTGKMPPGCKAPGGGNPPGPTY